MFPQSDLRVNFYHLSNDRLQRGGPPLRLYSVAPGLAAWRPGGLAAWRYAFKATGPAPIFVAGKPGPYVMALRHWQCKT